MGETTIHRDSEKQERQAWLSTRLPLLRQGYKVTRQGAIRASTTVVVVLHLIRMTDYCSFSNQSLFAHLTAFSSHTQCYHRLHSIFEPHACHCQPRRSLPVTLLPSEDGRQHPHTDNREACSQAKDDIEDSFSEPRSNAVAHRFARMLFCRQKF